MKRNELHIKYRPKKFSDVVGNSTVVSLLQKTIAQDNLPHAVLLTGDSGCGKTTLARILTKQLKCSKVDRMEINSSNFRGIDTIRSINDRARLVPMNGPCRVWIMDEFHQVTSQAQDAFLKLLEDMPDHVYFFLCTTDPSKLKKAVISRCFEVKVALLSHKETRALLRPVAKQEKIKLTEDVWDDLVVRSEGQPRKSLVLLHAMANIKGEEEQLEFLQRSDHAAEAYDLCRALFARQVTWTAVKKTLRELPTDFEVESVRYAVLGYASKAILGGSSEKAARVIDAFQDPFYDSKKAGLFYACYSICN